MADEITINAFMRAAKGGLEIARQQNGLNRDMAGQAYSAEVQTIGFAAHEALDIGADLATASYAWFRNLDETNFVEVGLEVSAAFEPFIKLLPGEVALVPLATVALYAQADTGAVKLEFIILAN